MSNCIHCKAYNKSKVKGNKLITLLNLESIGWYDVDKAKNLLTTQNIKPTKLDSWWLHELAIDILNSNFLELPFKRQHIFHITHRKPIIIGTYLSFDTSTENYPEGEYKHFVLEGNHRTVNAFLLGKQILHYYLNFEQTQKVFLGKRKPRNFKKVY